jgi:hypothetical protein
MNIPVNFDVFVEMCEKRRYEFCGDNLPDCVFYFYMEKIKENNGCFNHKNNDPIILVDNIYVNGAWGEIQKFKQINESDSEFKTRINAIGGRVFWDENLVIGYSPVMDDLIYRG